VPARSGRTRTVSALPAAPGVGAVTAVPVASKLASVSAVVANFTR